VGDVDGGDAEFPLYLADVAAESLAEAGVERAHRLVEQQEVGTRRERSRQGDPLLLAAGQFRRVARLEPLEADQLQQVGDALVVAVEADRPPRTAPRTPPAGAASSSSRTPRGRRA
jgi:hypothetical protein